jgi:DNA-directed RNA polymerase specialized sigma24 family protein
MDLRYLNISQMAAMFALSRDTVRARLRRAGVTPARTTAKAPLYDMVQAGPALFAAAF